MRLKEFIFVLLLLAWSLPAIAEIIELNPQNTQVALVEDNDFETVITYDVGAIHSLDVSTDEGMFTEIHIPGFAHINKIGEPNLPMSRKIIAVPLGAQIRFDVQHSEAKLLSLDEYGIEHPVMPAQQPVPKCDGPPPPFEYNPQAYQSNRFTDLNLVTTDELGILRGLRLIVVNVMPVRYNPMQNTLQVFEELTVNLQYVNADLASTRELREKTFSPYFEPVYQSTILNYRPMNNRDNLTRYPIKYVIISDPMFETQLQPFIDWKIEKGFEVIAAYTDDIGNTTTQIKDFIQDLYDAATPNDPAPSFVLFVGDTAQIPPYNGNTGNHITDLHYVRLEGTDYLPDMFYGRFSANNTTELQPQIDKTLLYERYEMSDPSYLNEAVLISGVDAWWASSHGNGHINYGTEHYFNASNNITAHAYLYPQSGNSGPQIISDVSNGVGYANYTAHGSTTSWADPSFTISDINNLQNYQKYPFVVGNCCVTNKFEIYECFGEAWLRAEDKGAIGYIGGNDNTYWNEDYWWGVGHIASIPGHGQALAYEDTGPGMFDGLFHTHGEPFPEWFTTGGAMIFAGNLAVEMSNSNRKDYYWEIYSLMGDPSLAPYMFEPSENIATYPNQIFIGMDQIQITADPYSYVGLSFDGELYGSALIEANGSITLDIDPFTTPGEATLVITRQNRIPIIETIDIIPADGPYVVVSDYTVNAGDDEIIEFGEDVSLDVEFENVGIETANNANAVATVDDQYISLDDDTVTLGDISAGELILIEEAFSFSVANNVPNNHSFTLEVVITDADDNVWDAVINLNAYAPVVEIEEIIVGADGILDPGETEDISVFLKNAGGAVIEDVIATLFSEDDYITINEANYTTGDINAGETGEAIFNITASDETPVGHVAGFSLDIEGHNEYSVQEQFFLTIGVNIEDFETGDFSAYPWEFTGNADWTIVEEAYEGDYAARSGQISHNQSSGMKVEFDVLMDGEISFWKKVSSENNYDYLRFYIDGQELGQWSGEVGWSESVFEVSAGTRVFEWRYTKDGSVSHGSDCAWVDYITFPSVMIPAPPEMHVDIEEINVELEADTTYVETFQISNIGGGNLTYSILLEETSTSSDRSIEGSYVECSEDEFTAGETTDWIFTVYNASTDMEWLTDVSISFPMGVTVNSSTDFIGGSGGPLVSDGTTGNGVTVHWYDDDGGWGNIHGDETAEAEVNVSISNGFNAPVNMDYHIIGDHYGAQPHEVFGNMILNPTNEPISWISLSQYSGSLFVGENDEIEVILDTSDLDDGTYTALMTIAGSDGSEVEVPITLNVYTVDAEDTIVPAISEIVKNYPNPFNPETTIDFSLKEETNVKVEIFNIKGQKVTTLIDDMLIAGHHSVVWNGTDSNGNHVSSGVYFSKMQAGNTISIRKMMLLK